MSKFLKVLVLVSVLALSAACGKGNNNNGMNGGGMNGPDPIAPTIDLSGAAGLLVVDPSGNSTTGARTKSDTSALRLGFDGDTVMSAAAASSSATGGDKSLSKLDDHGNPTPAISVESSGSNPGMQPQALPKILTIAVSPAHEIFLHFEHAFRHKAPDSTTTTANGPGVDMTADGTYCQIFRVKGGTIETLKTAAPTASNLECLTYHHTIDTWMATRSSVFQFDSTGNAYFSARVSGVQNSVVYRFDRATAGLTEMVNANICVKDFLVTKSGGLFYTGQSSCNGGGNSDGGYFRYVAAAGKLTQIANGWWNFIYNPVSTSTTDKAIFFGPDPAQSTTASWNSACLFYFDPLGGDTTAARTSAAITCGSDVWSWVNMTRKEDLWTDTTLANDGSILHAVTGNANFRDYTKRNMDWNGQLTAAGKTEYSNRCTNETAVFAGGGSQISAIKQDKSGTVYVIGNVQKKKKGSLECNLQITGPHCVINNVPDLNYSPLTGFADGPAYDTWVTSCQTAGGTPVDSGNCGGFPAFTTSSTCITAGHTWNRTSTWYNSVPVGTEAGKKYFCTDSDAFTGADWWNPAITEFHQPQSFAKDFARFAVSQLNCAAPSGSGGGGNQWTDELQALAVVDPATKTLVPISDKAEQAKTLFLVNDVVYYQSYNTSSGKYLLRKYNATTKLPETVLSDFETYNLSAGYDTNHLYYDGLDFTDNQYSFGTIDLANSYAMERKQGFTGTLKTIVILNGTYDSDF